MPFEHLKRELLEGSGGKLPQEIFKKEHSETLFPFTLTGALILTVAITWPWSESSKLICKLIFKQGCSVISLSMYACITEQSRCHDRWILANLLFGWLEVTVFYPLHSSSFVREVQVAFTPNWPSFPLVTVASIWEIKSIRGTPFLEALFPRAYSRKY